MSYQHRGRTRSYHGTRYQHSTYVRQQRSTPARRSNIDRSRYVNAAVAVPKEEAYVVRHTFNDFGLHDAVTQNVFKAGYKTPTPIQDQAIGLLMEGKDVVGIANTGTGKTAAFLLPFITKVMNDLDQGVLILAPTRELALQIFEEFKNFAASLPLGVCLCIGGMNIQAQINRLRDNPHFVIGTPGRIKDLIQRGTFDTSLFANVVLDEVDRMLDIGFRKDIQFLISQLPKPRQSAFFSATMNRDTEEIMREFLTNPVTVSVKKRETSHHIEQDVVVIKNGESKVDVLHSLLKNKDFSKVIVFGRTKHGINKLEKQLFERGLQVTAIHGNKNQHARQRALDKFKQGRYQALLTTDVAARGIDISDVSHVINYDEPNTYEDYVHRIGRTGRAGKGGKALTFVG